MKLTIIIFSLFGLIACDNHSDKTIVDDNAIIVHNDSIKKDSIALKEENRQIESNHQNCNFDYFLSDKNTPKLAKDIYRDNDWNLNKADELLSLLDSLSATNVNSRPFYCKVITKSFKKSDGYLSEGLGIAGVKYVENNTKEFISNFENKSCFDDNDMITWANILILEFSIGSDGGSDKTFIDDYVKKLNLNCKDCSPIQKENVRKFGLTLKDEWKIYLKTKDN